MFESLWLKLRVTYVREDLYKLSHPAGFFSCGLRKGIYFSNEDDLIEYIRDQPHRRPIEFRGFLDYQSHNLENKIYAEEEPRA